MGRLSLLDDGQHVAVQEELGRTIVQIVNEHGRDMIPTDNEICYAVVYTVMELGKGLHPAIPLPLVAVAAPPLSRRRCRRRLMPAPRARPLAVSEAGGGVRRRGVERRGVERR